MSGSHGRRAGRCFPGPPGTRLLAAVLACCLALLLPPLTLAQAGHAGPGVRGGYRRGPIVRPVRPGTFAVPRPFQGGVRLPYPVTVLQPPPGAPPNATLILGRGFPRGRDGYSVQRRAMVDEQLRRRGISQPEVLAAMDQVPRHLFLPPVMRGEAYADRALQLDPRRTIYQPYVVALMTSLLDLKRTDRVLEVGTGTGYHAAVLSRIAQRVDSIEIDPVVASQAGRALAGLGYGNVQVWVGDGYGGLPERAPFNAILLSAAPQHIPQPLIDQLRVGGRMVVPVGGLVQDLLVITKTPQGIEKRSVVAVRVSPMTGVVQDGH